MAKKIRRTNKHHRRSRSRTHGIPHDGDIGGKPNVIVVDYKRHQCFHCLFMDTHPEAIAGELNRTWIDPDWCLVAVPREKALKVFKFIAQVT